MSPVSNLFSGGQVNTELYNTGDLILFSGSGLIDLAIRYCSKSNYTHCGIVLRDPVYIDPKLIGVYFIESTFSESADTEDGKVKLGVTLHLLKDILAQHREAGDKIYVRKLQGLRWSESLGEKIIKAYESSKDIPYNADLTEWFIAKCASDAPDLEVFMNSHLFSDAHLQGTKSMWCTEFVGYFYYRIEVLRPDTPWSLLSPKNFSSSMEDLEFMPGMGLGKEVELVDRLC